MIFRTPFGRRAEARIPSNAGIEQLLDAAVDDLVFEPATVFELPLDPAQPLAKPFDFGLLHLRAGIVSRADQVAEPVLQVGHLLIFLPAKSGVAQPAVQLP